MDTIRAPTRIENTLLKAEFDYNPIPGTKAFGGLINSEEKDRLTGNIVEIGEPVK